MVSIKNVAEANSIEVSSVVYDEALFLGCVCEMMENVERKLRYTSDMNEYSQLNDHKLVIRKVLKQSLNLN